MVRGRVVGAQLMSMLLLIGALVLASGGGEAGAAFEVTCDEDGMMLVWPDVGADRNTYHVRRLNPDGSSTWVAKVTGAFSHQLEENRPDDTWIVRFRIDGVVNDWVCSEIAGPPAPVDPVTCWHYGGVLMWSTPDGVIVDGRYTIRELREAGTVWVRTVGATPVISEPDAIQNVATGFDRDGVYFVRFWVDVDGVETPVTARCWSWFAGQPVAPGAFVNPCIQTDHVLVWQDAEVDKDRWHARTADGSMWVDTFRTRDLDRADGQVATVMEGSDPVSLRWRIGGTKVDVDCERRFPVG